MKILLASIGTRGDIEPFLAMGEELHEQGHQVSFAFPEQFAMLVGVNFSFYPLSKRVLELIEGEEGRIIMGGKASIFRKAQALWFLYREGQRINRLLVRQQYEIVKDVQPDKIIHNIKCSYPILWSMQEQKENILLSPVPYFMYYVIGHAHVGFKGNWGQWLNRLSYRLANFGLVKTIHGAQQSLPMKKHFKTGEIRSALFSTKLFYAISPVLFQRPDYWPDHVQLSGFRQRLSSGKWQPDDGILQFLLKHQQVMFLTFGSMVNQEPEAISELIYETCRAARVPVIVNTSSGGLLALETFKKDPLFHFVDSIPYSWIMPRVYAVVHHGGSGSTHLGLYYGCATMILPHVIDQHAWNELVYELGTGPKGIAISKLSRHSLYPLLSDLWQNSLYKQKALCLSQKMQASDNQVIVIN